MIALPARNEMLRAFLASDASYDGVFLTAVRTTGIFCRPSCTARKPRPENVEFYASPRDALFAGYRPCLRCRPTAADDAPEWVARLIAHVDRDGEHRVTASDLVALGIEPARARRWFSTHYGMTFAAWCRARRLAGALASIRGGASIDDAVFDSGYRSHSGFREAFGRIFGAPPGAGEQLHTVHLAWIDTPLGPMIAAADAAGLCLLEFTDRRMLEAQLATLRRRLEAALVPGENAHTRAIRRQLGEYFAGTRRAFDVPLVHPGTAFQERVWKALARVPYGATCSYEALAKRIGSPRAVRAVGTANGLNRLAIVIPCHRVIGKDGSPVGYGGGVWRKRRLLELEAGGMH
jgi:AraC family transcriptional regulator, regulatory protein of adaptative response / methylated-DNA-[protein]-cysteine methyltransferase